MQEKNKEIYMMLSYLSFAVAGAVGAQGIKESAVGPVSWGYPAMLALFMIIGVELYETSTPEYEKDMRLRLHDTSFLKKSYNK